MHFAPNPLLVKKESLHSLDIFLLLSCDMWTVGQFMSTLLYFWSLIAFNLLIDGKFAESKLVRIDYLCYVLL